MIRKHYVRIMYMHVPVVALICVHCCVHMCITIHVLDGRGCNVHVVWNRENYLEVILCTYFVSRVSCGMYMYIYM